jgi:predicted acylesterase/phospholipase RssA
MDDAQPFSNVLGAELDHVRISRGRRKVEHPVAEGETISNRALDSGLMGVALSGGGIRSATLALGVLQGLAERGLIRQADYLSTVSGGATWGRGSFRG